MSVSGPGSSEYIVRGQIGKVNGKSGALSAQRSLSDKSITTLTSIGRDDPTTAEAQRAATVLRILQGSQKLLDESPWIRNIWFPSDDEVMTWPNSPLTSQRAGPSLPQASGASPGGNQGRHNLNSSQQEAVNTMASSMDSHRITIIQGPPGTGKTSVIAAFVQYAVEEGASGIWLVAQSNVAVKNIAEKLMDIEFLDWKLLVSKDFHFEWWVYYAFLIPLLFFLCIWACLSGMNISIPKCKIILSAQTAFQRSPQISSKIAKLCFAL